jgi:hypothetical protein
LPRLPRGDGGGGLLLASGGGACYHHNGSASERGRTLESRKRRRVTRFSRIRELLQGSEVRRGGFHAAGCHVGVRARQRR